MTPSSPTPRSWGEHFHQLILLKAQGGLAKRSDDPVLAATQRWLRNQKQACRQGALPLPQKRLLHNLGIPLPGPLSQHKAWLSRFYRMRQMLSAGQIPAVEKHPLMYRWMLQQRRDRIRGKLSPTRFARLESIGFPWTAKAAVDLVRPGAVRIAAQ